MGLVRRAEPPPQLVVAMEALPQGKQLAIGVVIITEASSPDHNGVRSAKKGQKDTYTRPWVYHGLESCVYVYRVCGFRCEHRPAWRSGPPSLSSGARPNVLGLRAEACG